MTIESSVALILAAGRGRRMGTPKALLQWKGKPLLLSVAQAYLRAGVEEILTVVSEEVRKSLGDDLENSLDMGSLLDLENALQKNPPSPRARPSLRFCIAPADEPMMESVRIGLKQVLSRHFRWIFLQPVDNGPPSKEIVEELYRALREEAHSSAQRDANEDPSSGRSPGVEPTLAAGRSPDAKRALAAKPIYGQRGGHPLLLSEEALTRLPWRQAATLREALSAFAPAEMLKVEVDDPRVLRNWNRREDLENGNREENASPGEDA